MRIIWSILITIALINCQPVSKHIDDTNGSSIRYEVHFDRVQHHELRIDIYFSDLGTDPLLLRMPQTSPGRYAVHNFAKNVYEVEVIGPGNQELELTKTRITEWEVSGHNGEVIFSYTLYGNHGDGTYTGIDNRKAHMNIPATFIYGVGLEERPIEITFNLENFPDWEIATQLVPLGNNTYSAPNYYYFFDSPTMIGNMKWRRWTVNQDDKEYTIEIAAMIEDSDEDLDHYTEWVKQIVDEQAKVYGSFPDFDFGRYTFLLSYNPWIYGDGMEHRNSTVCSSRRNLAGNADRLIGTISHEFFHAWNVERIRPATLEPFDFDQANMSDALWFAEGFTSYYDDLILKRTGIRSLESYIDGLTGGLNYVINWPGRQIKGPVEMSQHAPFVDAGTANDETNYANTFISYYTYGAVLGLALDLSIRSNFEGKSLDDLMQYMWEYFGKPEIPYQISDIEKGLTEVTSDPSFARSFFENYIYGNDLPDIPALLSEFGINMKLKNPGKAGFPSLSWEEKEDGLFVKGTMLRTNPLFESGLQRGDQVLEIDEVPVKTISDFERDWEIGSKHTIKYLQNGLEHTGSFTIKEDVVWELLINPDATDAQLHRRNKWLGD